MSSSIPFLLQEIKGLHSQVSLCLVAERLRGGAQRIGRKTRPYPEPAGYQLSTHRSSALRVPGDSPTHRGMHAAWGLGSPKHTPASRLDIGAPKFNHGTHWYKMWTLKNPQQDLAISPKHEPSWTAPLDIPAGHLHSAPYLHTSTQGPGPRPSTPLPRTLAISSPDPIFRLRG